MLLKYGHVTSARIFFEAVSLQGVLKAWISQLCCDELNEIQSHMKKENIMIHKKLGLVGFFIFFISILSMPVLAAEDGGVESLRDSSKGILIAQVTEDSPSDKAGLKPRDLIVEYEGKAVRGFPQ